MKRNLPYAEDDTEPYKSIENWSTDIRHLNISAIVSVVLGIVAYIRFHF